MAKLRMADLNSGYTSEVDTVDEQGWYQFLRRFDDASIFQTWAWGMVTSGRRSMSHLILKKNGAVVAIAQPRIVKVPLINAGFAYVRWGPLWKLRGTDEDREIFRQAIRALRNEYVCKRGLVLRLFPRHFVSDAPYLSEMLEEEGFAASRNGGKSRTILMDLSPSIETLRAGMKKNWRYELRAAERHGLEIMQGSEDHLFESFFNIYKEMISRKGFVPGANFDKFRSMQVQLPEEFKMRIMLCRSKEGVCAGLICSAIGKTAIYLFGATGNAGVKSRGSYLLQWKLIEHLKQCGVSIYDLYGINPQTNPGTYQFKRGLSGRNGKEVCSLGRFDLHASLAGYSFVELGERLKSANHTLRDLIRTSRTAKRWFKTAH